MRVAAIGATAVVLLVSLAACSEDVDNSEQPGATTLPPSPDPIQRIRDAIDCTQAESAEVDFSPIESRIADADVWWTVDSVVSSEPDDRDSYGNVFIDVSGRARSDDPISTARLAFDPDEARSFRRAMTEPDVEVVLTLGSRAEPEGTDRVGLGIAHSDTAFTFLGGCDAINANRHFDEIYGDSAVDVVRTVIGLNGDAALTALGQHPPQPTPPAPAQVVPGLTPGADDLESQTVWVTWPDESRSDERVICARSVVAWGTCVLLDAIGATPTSLVATTADGRPSDVELLLFGPDANLGEPIRLITTVPAGTFAASGVALVSLTALAIDDGKGADALVVEACDEPVELGEADTTLAMCPGYAPAA